MKTDILYPNETFRGGEQFHNFPSIGLHMHDNYELALYLSHKLHIINGAYTATIPAPFLILHRPFTLHSIISAEADNPPYRRYVYNCSQSFLKGIDPAYVDIDRVFSEDVRIFRLNDAQLERLLPMMELLSDRRDDRHQRRFLFCALLCEIERLGTVPAVPTPNKSLQYISAIIRHITEHYADDITTADLAAMHFISVPKLNRDFRRYTQTTVHEMLLRVRMQKAAEFLAAGTSVADTAHKCGFVNESHFIRTFRSFYQTTPLRWVKASRSEE